MVSDEVRRSRENLESHLMSIDSRLISAQQIAAEADLGDSDIEARLRVAQFEIQTAMMDLDMVVTEP